MGLRVDYLDYILESIFSTLGDMLGKTMLELGDQEIMGGGIVEKTGKEYFEKRGVLHTSIDLNGLHGAIKVDLAKPIKNPKWQNHFDIITNSGTSQHIEPKKAQYICFMNVHNLLKVGGIAVHLVPDHVEMKTTGRWKNIANNYYSSQFFEMLAESNDYRTISIKIIDGNICTCLQKQFDRPFMKDREKFLKYILREKGGMTYPGINESWFKFYARRTFYYLKNPGGILGMIRRKFK